MIRGRMVRWWSWLALTWVVAACAGPTAVDGAATNVAYFRTATAEIERGAEVQLEWRVDHAGARVGEASCALLRKVGGAPWGEPIAVACDGAHRDNPPYPPGATAVTYRLRVIDRATASSGGYLTRDVTVTFRAPAITLEPTEATLAQGASRTFAATVTGAVDAGVAWSASGGTVRGSGSVITYTAPFEAGSFALTATSVADPSVQATATITTEAVSIAIDPIAASVLVDGTVAFSAVVAGTVDAGVSWSTSCGSISGSGGQVTFVAPSFVASCVVTASSAASPSVSASASVAVGAVAVAIDPTSATLDQGGSRSFSAVVSGAADDSLVWDATGGSLAGSGGSVVFTAPLEAGSFVVTAASTVDPSAVAMATVQVREAGVTLTPASATMLSEASRSFTASVSGLADRSLVWSATGGTLIPTGSTASFVAPASAGSYEVSVASAARPDLRASATVVVERVAITVDPEVAHLETDGTTAFAAQVTGTSDTRVTWSASCGSISGTGTAVTFVAPAFAATCSVTATSLADGRRSATATVHVTEPPTGAVQWSVAFGSDEHDRAAIVATDASGGVYVAGTTEGVVGGTLTFPQGATDAFVRKYDANGSVQWTWQLGTSAAERVLLLEPQPDGDVIIGGVTEGTFATSGASGGNLFLARFDAASQTLAWVQEFGGDLAANTSAMARDAQGNVLVGVHTDPYLLLAKFDPDGQELWRSSYPDVYYGSARRILIDDTGHATVAGEAYRWDFVLRVDPNGAVVWRTSVGGIGEAYFGNAEDVAIDPQGNALVVSSLFFWASVPDMGSLAKVEPGGDQVWVRDVGPGADTTATAVAAALDGSALVGGWSDGDMGLPGSGSGAYVAKHRPNGDRVWVQRFTDVPTGFASIAVDGQGATYAVATVAGLVDGRPDPDGSGNDVFLVKLGP